MTHAFSQVPDNLDHSSHKSSDSADDGAVTNGAPEPRGDDRDGAVSDGLLDADQATLASDVAASSATDEQRVGQSNHASENLTEDEPKDVSPTAQELSSGSESIEASTGGDRDRPTADGKTASQHREETPEDFWKELRSIVLLSVALALGIRHFIAEARYIPSESMLPTLEINDRLIVEKMSYRFREPARGDVVVFKPTDTIKQENPTFNDALIKRIVGLPGETVEVREGKVFVDGEAIVENYIQEAPAYMWGPQEVPEDSYLVLGDNRNNSYDSHFWGFVPKDNLIGRAAVRVWPPNRLGALDEQPAFYFEEEGVTTPPAE